MPNRLIRDALLDNERYWSVTIESRQFFMHLMLLADDFGCVSLAPLFLRRRCFNDAPSNEKISRLINELVDVDLIRPYDHERCCYAFIPRFRQRLQRATLKHPKPPESLLFGDDDAIQKFNKINEQRKNSTDGKRGSTVGQPPEVKRREEKNYIQRTSALEKLTALGVPEQAANDWLAVRKAKRAPLTDTAIDALKREAAKANLSIADAVSLCAVRSWQGFKAEWAESAKADIGLKPERRLAI